MKKRIRISKILAITVLVVFLGSLAVHAAQQVVFWQTETEKDRVEIIKSIVSDFEEAYPNIKVTIVTMDENDIPKKIAAAKATGTLPDVVELGLAPANMYAAEGLSDPIAAKEVVDSLGAFREGPLKLLTVEGGYSAVPLDAWVQLIYYRKDLFAAAGLEPPTNWSNLLKAAKALNNPPNRWGIAVGSNPERLFTQQGIEHFALSNGARLFDKEGNVVVNAIGNRTKMTEVLDFYVNDLIKKYGPPGYVNWSECQQYYLTDRVAMAVYATYLLGDIARRGAGRPWTATVKDLPAKTGVVTTLEGPTGAKGNYGELYTLAIMKGTNEEEAKTFVKYLLSDGYSKWLSMIPVGKAPVRDVPEIVASWAASDVFKEFSPDLPNKILQGINTMQRWGYLEGKSYPVPMGKAYAQLVFPRAIEKIRRGEWSIGEALANIQEELEAFLK